MKLLSLPWPDKAHSQNARVHWTKRAHATKRDRNYAFIECKEIGVPSAKSARLTFTYHPPDHRRRDAQNLPAMLKAYIDGISDHLRCDDSEFQCVFPSGFGDVRPGGEIVVRIEASK